MENILSMFDPQELRHFFEYLFTSMSLEVIIKILISCLLIIWFAVAVWVIKDITTRSTSILIQAFSLLLIIFFTPIFGLPLYLLIRPRSTLFEQHYEETWLESFDKQNVATVIACLNCETEIDVEAKFCPHCGTKQFDNCHECGSKMLLSWKYCTSCGAHRTVEKPAATTKEKETLPSEESPAVPPKAKKAKR